MRIYILNKAKMISQVKIALKNYIIPVGCVKDARKINSRQTEVSILMPEDVVNSLQKSF